jgi:hypothetical protein
MFRMVNLMFRKVPIHQMRERPVKRIRPSKDNGERLLEAYFAVLTIVILGMIVGTVAYAVVYVIPSWQRSHSPRNQENPLVLDFRSHTSERQ